MARHVNRRPVSEDILASLLDRVLPEADFLVASGGPEPEGAGKAILLHPALGATLVTMHTGDALPAPDGQGGVAGLPEAGGAGAVVAVAKEAMGPGARTLPLAWLAWFPELPPDAPVPEGTFPEVFAGDDLEALRPALESCLRRASRPVSRAEFAAVEAALRARPGGVPPARSRAEEGGSSFGAGVSVAAAPALAMPPGDPMLVLLSHVIANAVEECEVSMMGNVELMVSDLASPTRLLPALLVVAAEDWALFDLSSGQRGGCGFHVHLSSRPQGSSESWSGYVVSDIRASTALVMTLGVSALLRGLRDAEGRVNLDSVINRYARFMERAGHASVELKRMYQAALRG